MRQLIMKKIKDTSQLEKFIEIHCLQLYMSTDIASIANLYRFDKGETLITEGTISKYLYFLVDGTVMVFSNASDNRTILIDYAQPVVPLGEASSLWGLSPNNNVQAFTDCLCVCISLEDYQEALQNDVVFLKNICQTLSLRLNSGINLAISLTESVESRLSKFILTYEKNGIFSFQLTICATILNVSYRHLLRTITNFCAEDILVKKKKHYLINNYSMLQQLADGYKK